MPSGDGAGASGGAASDPLAGIAGLGSMASGGGLASILPNPGKFDEVEQACTQILTVDTWEGLTVDYNKCANQSQVAQLLTGHSLKLGNARTEGYSLTSTYASQSLLCRG